MVRLDYYLFGYFKLRVKKEHLKDFLNQALLHKLSLKINSSGEFLITLWQKKRLNSIFSKDIFTYSELLGLPAVFLHNKKRYGFIVGILLVSLLFFLTSGVVWDVRISAEEGVDTVACKELLRTSGLYVGAVWDSLDNSKIENSLLLSSPDVGWVNINRRGSVAYVEIRKKDTPPDKEMLVYSNIVAAYDGIIEEISVKSGFAVVKPGDSVRAGDLLVSGVMPSELGGQIVDAEATVIAKRTDIVSVEIGSRATETMTEAPKLLSLNIKIFNFSVNILNFSGNFDEEYAIIEKNTPIFIFDKKIPLEFNLFYATHKRELEVEYSRDEMTALAREELNGKMLELLKNSTLLSAKTSGGFNGDKYTLTATITHSLDIAKELRIDVSAQ